MATYRDFDGVYFTLQALRMYQNLDNVELLVVDNFGCDATRQFIESWTDARYVRFTDAVGTAAPIDRLFQEARGKAVLCLDCHVLLVPGAVARLKRYFRDRPHTGDLLQGPLLYDDLGSMASHFDPVWQNGMWGVWGFDARADNARGRPFDIPMQGLGLFACRKAAWPGFNPHFRGFGAGEGYIHQKFRNRGRRCLCLPWLRWVHRFGRPAGVPYPMDWRDRIVNYLLGHREVGLDEAPVIEHFQALLGPDVVATAKAEADRLSPLKRVHHVAKNAARTGAGKARAPVRVRTKELISCLMPTYNRPPHGMALLEEAVESFLRQDYPNKELLVLNDTPGQILDCSAPGVTVFNVDTRMPDLGTKVAYLIERARGNVFCRWDDDDIHLPWRLSLSLRKLGKRGYWRPTGFWFDDGVLRLSERLGYYHSLGIFRRNLLDRIGGYPRAYAADKVEDVCFNEAAAREGMDFAEDLSAAEHFYIYRWNTGSPHVSALGCGNEAWRQRGTQPIVPGRFQIEPRWQRDYVEQTRQAAAAEE
jgi:glycosyltransferase involved in cell wall biosynthesis